MHHAVHASVTRKGEGDVVFEEVEPRVRIEVSDILEAAGEKIVDRGHFPPLVQQPVAQMGPYESRSAAYDDV